MEIIKSGFKEACVKFSDCFEPVMPPEDDDYKRGFLDGWIKCADYFIKHELNKE